MRCFNLGLVLLAVSGILALVPPDHEATPLWRWTAAGAVAATVVGIGVARAWPGGAGDEGTPRSSAANRLDSTQQ